MFFVVQNFGVRTFPRRDVSWLVIMTSRKKSRLENYSVLITSTSTGLLSYIPDTKLDHKKMQGASLGSARGLVRSEYDSPSQFATHLAAPAQHARFQLR